MYCFKYSIIVLIIIFSSSCSETVQKRGLSNFKINEINLEIGKTNRKNLVDKYGPPIFQSVFNENKIYYVTHISSYKNFSKRKTKSLSIYEITLNEKNIVSNIEKYTENDIIDIEVSDKKGKSDSKSIMFWQELLENMRRRNLQD